MLSTDKSNVAHSFNSVYTLKDICDKYPDFTNYFSSIPLQDHSSLIEFINLYQSKVFSANNPVGYVSACYRKGTISQSISYAKSKQHKYIAEKKAAEPYKHEDTQREAYNRAVATNIKEAMDKAVWNQEYRNRTGIDVEQTYMIITWYEQGRRQSCILKFDDESFPGQLEYWFKKLDLFKHPEFRQHEVPAPAIPVLPLPEHMQRLESKTTQLKNNPSEIENKVSNYPPIDYNDCIIKVKYDDGRYFQQNSSHIHKPTFDRYDRHQASLHGSVSVGPLFTSQSDQLHSGQSKSSG